MNWTSLFRPKVLEAKGKRSEPEVQIPAAAPNFLIYKWLNIASLFKELKNKV